MGLNIEVDRTGEIPVYRQIIEQVTSLVRQGALKPGDQLPPERELSSQLGIARGTITKAYAELSRAGILEVTQGRGSFVSARQDVLPTGRKERAVELIRGLLGELAALRFSPREIRSLIDLVLAEQEEQIENLNIAAIDCSPEALRIFGRQLGYVAPIGIKTILLGELTADPDPERRLSCFDLVLTTSTHYSEVLAAAQGLKDRLIQVVVSPSQETIISLAGIKPDQALGAVCESAQFHAIIRDRLESLGIANALEWLTYPCEADRFEAFVGNKDVLIVPPGFQSLLSRDTARVVAEFTEGGGKLVAFDYQIERGSLVYFEERVRGLLQR